MSKAKLPQRSTMIVLAAVVAIVVGIGIYSRRDTIFASKKAAAGPTSVIVKTETVRPDMTIADKIIQNMSVDAEKRVELLPRVTGRLLALSVKQGDYVRKGEQVATLEHDQQNAQILSTAAQAASARADTEKAKAQMLNAKTNLERYHRLEKEGFSTKQQLETMETEYTSAAASYRAAQAKERQYEAEAARVQSAKDDYIIRAPLDGIVLNDYSLTQGAMISPSSPILDIADLRRLKATLKVPESKIFIVTKGMPVLLKFDALPGETFEGSVTRIDQYVDPATRTSNVEIALDNEKQAGGRLRPGMFGQASIVEKEFRNSITIPEGALRSSEKGYYVLLVKDGRAEMREVETGVRENSRVQITKGLVSGDEVITFGGNNLNSGEEVTAQN
ncbi:MAG: efflux RND transporter periplasmic adaptor subunit [Cloacibacillus porcorum]|uniref:efflux RND transporter periplasmic adaptor subunit n=1 Tax=Cloacibacillus porcorum TaxID=1197717 RepID=UPI0023F3CF93|nr:efflux RND transporter periplasmic adaptor subunit [Cloacibacillus porcorum]MCD7876159.1 efflux RND transporter periplasmic adaptor subunit [Cloacibacillus porcorum]